MRLTQQHTCNGVLVKLIEPENRMTEWHDQHDGPNIDVNTVIFKGRQHALPQNVQFML